MEVRKNSSFYSKAYLYFLMAFAVTVAGFWPSYFSRLGETGPAHHFHGITASLWMLILIIQPLLYRLNKMEVHRMVGRSTFLLVPLVVIGGVLMMHMMLSNPAYGPLAYQLAFIDLFVLIQFVLFYVLAIKNVRDTQYHARYMACTIFGPLIPALTRLLFHVPWVDSFGKSLHVSYLLINVVLLLLIYDDKRKGKIRLPYVLAFGLMVTQQIMMHFASEWDWWRTLMDLFSGVSY